MVPDVQKVWMDRMDGGRQNYIPQTLSGIITWGGGGGDGLKYLLGLWKMFFFSELLGRNCHQVSTRIARRSPVAPLVEH